MFTEINWAGFDKLVEVYAILASYTDKEKQIEYEIASLCENLCARRASLEDFTEILGRRPQQKEEVIRKTAWAAQHIFGCRAWCVGQKVLFHRRYEKRWESALVEQLQRLAYKASDVNLRAFHDKWPRNVVPQDRLDALLVDAKADTIHLVKGASFGQLDQKPRSIALASREPSLFSMDEKAFLSTRVDTSSVATLVFARDLLQAVFPQLTVKAHFIVMDNPGATWRFQSHDLSATAAGDLASEFISLDRFRVSHTHHDFAHILTPNDDAFASLPHWATSDFLGACPVDRPTRCLMLLREMLDRQQNRPSKLVQFKPRELAIAVSERWKIAYAVDLSRHDFEDCLERSRFVERWNEGDKFVLLPKGVARLLVVVRKFNPMTTLSPGELLTALADQARLLANAPVL